jgi:hypothetical protein
MLITLFYDRYDISKKIKDGNVIFDNGDEVQFDSVDEISMDEREGYFSNEDDDNYVMKMVTRGDNETYTLYKNDEEVDESEYELDFQKCTYYDDEPLFYVVYEKTGRKVISEVMMVIDGRATFMDVFSRKARVNRKNCTYNMLSKFIGEMNGDKYAIIIDDTRGDEDTLDIYVIKNDKYFSRDNYRYEIRFEPNVESDSE